MPIDMMTEFRLVIISFYDRCGPFEYTDSVLCRVLFPGGYIAGGVAYNFVTDWQGNVRQVVDGSTGEPVQETHYYPYGMPFAESAVLELKYIKASCPNPYRFGGKEWVTAHGADLYDFGARGYNYAIGNWDRIDRYSEKYYPLNPYTYCAGDPVNNMDINGDSIFVGEQYREQFMSIIEAVYGSTSNFGFSSTGMLTYNGDTKSFNKDLKKVHKGLDKYMKSNDVVEVRFGSNSATDINGKTTAFSTRNEGGAATYFPEDNGATGNCIILIDPKINMLYNVTPINENTFYRYPYGTPDVARYLGRRDIPTNIADMFFHELGHLLYKNYEKVIDYNNHVRKILNLEKRPYDQNHNRKPDPIYMDQ